MPNQIDTVWRDRPTKDPATWTGADKVQQVFEYRIRTLVLAAKSGKLTPENKDTLKRVIRAWSMEKAHNPSADPKTSECVTPNGAASCDAVLTAVETATFQRDTWYDRNVKGNGVKIVTGAAVVGGLWWWFKGRK